MLMRPIPIELDEASHLLLEAANRIRRRGWCQHRPSDFWGRMCIMGAVYNVKRHVDYIHMKYDNPIANEAQRRLNNMGYDYTWNDKLGRTKAEVIDALLHTAHHPYFMRQQA